MLDLFKRECCLVLRAYAFGFRKLLIFPLLKAIAGLITFVPLIFLSSFFIVGPFYFSLPEPPQEMGLIYVFFFQLGGILMALPLTPWAHFIGSTLLIWKDEFEQIDSFDFGAALKTTAVAALLVGLVGLVVGLNLTWVALDKNYGLFQPNQKIDGLLRLIPALIFPLMLIAWIAARLLFIDRGLLAERGLIESFSWSWRLTRGHNFALTLFVLSGYLVLTGVILLINLSLQTIEIISPDLSPYLPDSTFIPVSILAVLIILENLFLFFICSIIFLVISAGYLLMLFARISLFREIRGSSDLPPYKLL